MTEPFLGSIQYFGFNFAPRGYALCNGATMNLNQNQALFALLGTTYGGDGRTTFGLPDMQGRTMIGYGNGANLPVYNIGAKGGSEGVTMTPAQMPAHTHTVTALSLKADNDAANTGTCTGAYMSVPENRGTLYGAAPDTNTFLGAPTFTIGSAGSNQPISLMSPYLALTCCIAITGIFPSRN